MYKKVHVDNGQERRNQKVIHTPNTEVRKTKLTIRYEYFEPSEQLFPNRRPLSYPNLTETIKSHMRFKQHKTSTPKHKTNKTTTEVSPWNDQLYKITLGEGLNRFYNISNLTLIFRSGSQHFHIC